MYVLHPPTWTLQQNVSQHNFLTSGTVRTDTLLTLSVTTIAFLSANFGRHSHHSPVSNSRCLCLTTPKLMAAVNALTRLSSRHFITLSTAPSQVGPVPCHAFILT